MDMARSAGFEQIRCRVGCCDRESSCLTVLSQMTSLASYCVKRLQWKSVAPAFIRFTRRLSTSSSTLWLNDYETGCGFCKVFKVVRPCGLANDVDRLAGGMGDVFDDKHWAKLMGFLRDRKESSINVQGNQLVANSHVEPASKRPRFYWACISHVSIIVQIILYIHLMHHLCWRSRRSHFPVSFTSKNVLRRWLRLIIEFGLLAGMHCSNVWKIITFV